MSKERTACGGDWCCTACQGSGWAGQEPCTDCLGTGHTHSMGGAE